LSFTNERVREYFAAESAEVKEEVRAKAEAERRDVLLDGENGEELEPEERKRQKLLNYQRLASCELHTGLGYSSNLSSARESLPMTIIAMLEQVEHQTGLIGTVMFAGPDLEQGGNIYSMTWVSLPSFRGHQSDYELQNTQWANPGRK
jgi:hypothetical protein